MVDSFHQATGLSADEYFCSCDPVGSRLGSGGGTVWLLQQAREWLGGERSIMIHAGGRSQRLPSYAVQGKVLLPLPLGPEGRSKSLLSLQLPLYEQIMQQAPESLRLMVVSGDVLILASEALQPVPEADVVCYGLLQPDAIASHHGVFVMDRQEPSVLLQMLQKPSLETLASLHDDHLCLTDIGIWLFSQRAIDLLHSRCEVQSSKLQAPSAKPNYYDLYGTFGLTLGTHPTLVDAELNNLSVAILPLQGGEFHHFGTSRELVSSTLAVARSMGREMSSVIVQQSEVHCPLSDANHHIWIDSSYVGERWTLTSDNIVTGVPRNDWEVHLEPGECIDVVPVGDHDYEQRHYHIDDRVDSDDIAIRANLRRMKAQNG